MTQELPSVSFMRKLSDTAKKDFDDNAAIALKAAASFACARILDEAKLLKNLLKRCVDMVPTDYIDSVCRHNISTYNVTIRQVAEEVYDRLCALGFEVHLSQRYYTVKVCW